MNGKYLSAPLNGVHRVAEHLTRHLLSRPLTDREGTRADVTVMAPSWASGAPAFAEFGAESVPGLLEWGQYWENVTLARRAWNDILVSFCNLAPVMHPRSVVMIHDAQTFLCPADYSSRQVRAYRTVLPVIGHRALRVLTVSDFARQSLVDFGIAPAERIHVVPNGADHILDAPADRSILADHGLMPGEYWFAIGSTKGYKNMARLFDLFGQADLASRRLVLAGGANCAAYRAAGFDPPNNVAFVGLVSDPQLRALYEGAAGFLFPSLTEGFGLPPVEAMTCGAPVIAAHAGAMPGVCGDGACLVDPGSTAAWRDAVLSLEDPAVRAGLIARGTTRAAGLTWDASGRALAKAISDLV